MAYNKALIVDDSKLARITLKRKLEALGLTVALAESGKEALAMIPVESPDIVFMDHLMPELDGFEATKTLRADPTYVDLPIIMCTGKDHDGYLEEAKAIGANQILSKPPVDEALTALLATDFSVGVPTLDATPITLDADDLGTMDDASFGAGAPILDMDMLGGDDNVSDLTNEVSSDLEDSADALDLGTNVLDSSVPKAEPLMASSEPESTVVEQTQSLSSEEITLIAERVAGDRLNAVSAQIEQVTQSLNKTQKDVSSIDEKIQAAVAAVGTDVSAELPSEQIESLVTSFIDKERISLVAEVLASVPEPTVPEFDVPTIDYDRVNDQIVAKTQELKASILAEVDSRISQGQKQLISKIEALLKDRLASVSSGPSAEEIQSQVGSVVDAKASAISQAAAADFSKQLKQRETVLLQHLEASKAATKGLLSEMAVQEPTPPSQGDTDVSLDIEMLKTQHKSLESSQAMPKIVAFASLGLAVVALALAVLPMI